MMNVEEELHWLVSLSAEARGIFLVELVHALTTIGRMYSNSLEVDPGSVSRVRAVISICHGLSGHLRFLMRGEEAQVFLPVLMNSIETVSDPELRLQLDQAWNVSRNETLATINK
ncbi:hypothetical protein [Tahibacter amnicola]|uniref:Hpt domain-containing protein n=1 Tax=Tahibacter amnicola TaxID=2976241 RepID=A0ABY6BHL6_9GAMM|nr:hypothetical protein [Tahibacter amnicola]UXI67870.1 hypothetical protein N4264_24585 [Tahibacter amnicola]